MVDWDYHIFFGYVNLINKRKKMEWGLYNDEKNYEWQSLNRFKL
jgi:hypothetical protein